MTETTLKQKTAKGLFWGGISSGAEQVFGVIFGICLARMLNADDYGLVGMLAIFSGIITTVINSGFSVALINKHDAIHKDYNAVFWFTFLVGLISYAILFFSAPFIARFFGRPELINLSRVLFINIFLGGITAVPAAVMYKRLMIKPQAIIVILSQLISGSVGIFLAFKGYAYWALVIQNTVLVFLGFILRYIYMPWKPDLKIDFKPLKEMFSFSIKLLITGIFSAINSNVLSVLFGKFYNAIQLGYYAQGQKWTTMGHSFVTGMINQVSQPVLVQVKEDKERQVSVLRKMIRFGAFVSFPMILGLAFIGNEFIVIAIGEKWQASVPFLQLFCIWGAILFLWNLLVNVIFMHGKSNIYMYVTVSVGLLQVLVVVCMYHLGIFFMVIGYILIYFVGLLVWQYYVHKLIGLRLTDVLKDIMPYLLITLGCFFVTWLITRNIPNLYILLVAKIVITVILYVMIMKTSNSVIFKESITFLLNHYNNKTKK
jgi:O-antigen/teichoic acid export membrane protein